jgi:hypothetical protein
MKLDCKTRQNICSATITQSLWLTLLCSGLFALTAFGSPPAWWNSRGVVLAPQVVTNSGVVTTNYVPNDYAAVTQGQLKQITARAVDELNANLSGGAGTNLNSMMTNWANDYATNGYSATNIEPSDFHAIKVGQVKYIANLFYGPLISGGYMATNPAWLQTNSVVDSNIANIGQLKQAFDFEISAPQTPDNLTVIFGGTGATISWSDPVVTILNFIVQYSTDGGVTWSTLTTVSGSVTSATVTGLILGTNYQFRVTASNAGGSSAPSSSDAAPIITLITPFGATLVP